MSEEKQAGGYVPTWIDHHPGLYASSILVAISVGLAGLVYYVPRPSRTHLDDGRVVHVKRSIARGYIEGKLEMPRVSFFDEDGDYLPDYKMIGPNRFDVTQKERDEFHKAMEGVEGGGEDKMTKTLYNALQDASVTAETFDGNVGLSIFHNVVSEDSVRELKGIEERELKGLKRRIIEAHAGRHQSVADVVDGSTTFHSYGEPIIEQLKRVEDRYRDRNLGLVRKSEFLGKGPRDPAEVQEAVQYLRREEVINPNEFFRSKLILPQTARKIIDGWAGLIDFRKENRKALTYLGVLAATTAAGAYFGHKVYGTTGGAFGGGIGGYALAGVGTIFPWFFKDATFDRISKQREFFEDALKTLDSEVRGHFPLDSNLREVRGRK